MLTCSSCKNETNQLINGMCNACWSNLITASDRVTSLEISLAAAERQRNAALAELEAWESLANTRMRRAEIAEHELEQQKKRRKEAEDAWLYAIGLIQNESLKDQAITARESHFEKWRER